MTRTASEIYAGPKGRRRAWRELMIGDHGLLRKFYDNTHVVSPGKLFRSYQPSPKELVRWKERGVKTVINLRGQKPSGFLFLEEEACTQLGLTHINFRVFSREAPSKEILHGAKKLFDEIAYPALIHCKSGADRAGLMSTLYLFFHESRPLDEALEQLSFRYGHIKQGKTGVIDFAFAEYSKFAHENGISLSSVDKFFEWIDSEAYDHKELKARFRSKGWANLLTETILRRE